MIPFTCAALGMILIGRSSDLRRERRMRYCISMTPILAMNTVRLFPSAAMGLQLNIDEFDTVSLEAGHFTRQTGVDTFNSDDKFTTD